MIISIKLIAIIISIMFISHILKEQKINNRRLRFYDVTAQVFMRTQHQTVVTADNLLQYQIPLYYFYYLFKSILINGYNLIKLI